MRQRKANKIVNLLIERVLKIQMTKAIFNLNAKKCHKTLRHADFPSFFLFSFFLSFFFKLQHKNNIKLEGAWKNVTPIKWEKYQTSKRKLFTFDDADDDDDGECCESLLRKKNNAWFKAHIHILIVWLLGLYILQRDPELHQQEMPREKICCNKYFWRDLYSFKEKEKGPEILPVRERKSRRNGARVCEQ
jgi:hypothetical protein